MQDRGPLLDESQVPKPSFSEEKGTVAEQDFSKIVRQQAKLRLNDKEVGMVGDMRLYAICLHTLKLIGTSSTGVCNISSC